MEIAFNNPEFLTLLIFIPILFIMHFFLLKHNKRKAMKFSNFDAMKRVSGTTLFTKNISQLLLRSLIIIILVLGASRAVLWYDTQASIYDYVIAIDSGASMTAQDVGSSRFDTAKIMARELIENLNSNIALISFSGTVSLDGRLTNEKQSIYDSLNKIEVINNPGTDLAESIIVASNILSTSQRSKAIILLSDGHDTVGTQLGYAINYVGEKHIPIYAIGVGTVQGGSFLGLPSSIGAISQLNEKNLNLIANQTGGKYFDYSLGVDKILDQIEIESKTTKMPLELSFYMMSIALILIIFEWIISNTRFRLLP